MHPDATITLPNEWRYVNEGGATIVFRYVGRNHPLFTGSVLRLRKTILGPTDDPTDDDPDDPSVAFQQRVTARLVPEQYLPRLEVVRVQGGWLKELSTLAQSHRPLTRREKDVIDIGRTKGVLATDLVGSGITVELKPKWGFMPNISFLSADTAVNKTQFCRYCMHSKLKLQAGEHYAAGYCPMDLYSNNEERIERALTTLWEDWLSSNATINNLRIFMDGDIVTPNSGSFANLSSYLASKELSVVGQETSEIILSKLKTSILNTSLFSVLQQLQRDLDSLDIEGLLRLWETANVDVAKGPFNGVEGLEPTMDDWSSFIEEYLSSEHQKIQELPGPNLATLKYHILSYLLSASFKDCSVMLRLHPLALQPELYVIDLDPKSVSRLAKWHKLDQAIAKEFDGRNLKACIDANTI